MLSTFYADKTSEARFFLQFGRIQNESNYKKSLLKLKLDSRTTKQDTKQRTFRLLHACDYGDIFLTKKTLRLMVKVSQ